MLGVYRRPPMDAEARDPTTLESAWPLFGLRIRSEHLVLRLPTDDDVLALIDVAKAGIHPPDEMPFGVAWSIVPSPAFERSFVQHHWGVRAAWTPEAWTLNLLVELDGRPIGSQSIHANDFAIHRIVDTGSWLGQAFQGRGLGKEMRAAVLSFAFDGLGARVAESAAFPDNLASSGVSRSLGYEDNGLGALAPQGVSRVSQRFRMTAEGWASRPRPPVAIDGLEACRELFGA
jgi:RimJ/RimL family protein N-acetyltransferase